VVVDLLESSTTDPFDVGFGTGGVGGVGGVGGNSQETLEQLEQPSKREQLESKGKVVRMYQRSLKLLK